MWKTTFFGLRYGQDLENRAARPHREFPGVPPHHEPLLVKPPFLYHELKGGVKEPSALFLCLDTGL